MGIRFKFGKMSPLLPDERVLHNQACFRAVSSACLPSYRIWFNLPPLWATTLFVTNRRCLVVTDLFRAITQEVDMWYSSHNPDDRTDIITTVSCKKGLFGRCLEIRSRDPKRPRQWLCSPNMTVRFFLKNPESVENVILAAMNQKKAANR